MSASEFAFLALGLVLGVASGAALIEVLRSRPPVPREVRLTVAQDSVPRRASTLSTAVAPGSIGPAPFGPADRRGSDRAPLVPGSPGPAGVADPGVSGAAVDVADPAATRTDVRFTDPVAAGPAVAGGAGPGPVAGAQAVAGASGADLAPTLVGIAIEPEEDGFLAAIRAAAVAPVGVAAARSASGTFDDGDPPRAEGSDGSSAVGSPGDGGSSAGGSVEDGPPGPGGPAGAPTTGPGGPVGLPAGSAAVGRAMTDPCADLRRIADERCAVADGLVLQAETAMATLREKQREFDDHETSAAKAADGSDPRLLRAAKETAQHVFRAASAAATSPTEVEAAARTWLQEINRINRVAREASLTLRRERDAVNELVPILERLSVEADAARINAEAAREACVAAREAVATCEEETARRQEALAVAALASQAAVPEPAALGPDGRPIAPGPDDGEPAPMTAAGGGPDRRDEGAVVERAGAAAAADGLRAVKDPLVFHLLAGDDGALRRAVEALAGEDPAEQGAWRLQLNELIDAVRSRAIEASSLDFPIEHRFWGPFTREQCRDIAAALGSLGYRFDGLGGFADGRVPSQRDLSLAVGFAGLDPMRIRIWPNESEMADLFRDVTVAADEYISATAPGLTLGEMVTLLGRRADGLTDLWNAWGRVRPLLLAPA